MEKNNKCMFSNDPADTVEHVIPRWLQRKFNLQDKTYSLPNGTSLKYKNAVAPASSIENGNFGIIEDRIANGNASEDEIFLWALKIHVGLIHISSNLKFDIRDPKSPKFWDVDDFGKDVWLFQKLYGVWKKGGRITPSPFGTVIKIRSLMSESEFDFVHNIQSRTLLIKVGRDIIFVCFLDKGFVKKSRFDVKFEQHRDALMRFKEEEKERYELRCFVTQRVWACEASYFNYRLPKKFTFVASDRSFVSPLSILQKVKNEDEQELRCFCTSFGLRLEKYHEKYANAYSNITTDEHNDMVIKNLTSYRSEKSS